MWKTCMDQKYLDFARELKKSYGTHNDGDANYNWGTRNDPQRLGKGAGRAGTYS